MGRRKRRGSGRQQVVARQSASLPQEVLNQEQLERQISEKALQRNANSSGNPPDPEPEPAAKNSTPEDIQVLVQAAAQEAVRVEVEKVKAENQAVVDQLQQQISEYKQQIEAANATIATNNADVEKAQKIIKATSMMGNPVPVGSQAGKAVGANFNTLVGSHSDKVVGSHRELLEHIYHSESATRTTKNGVILPNCDYDRASIRAFMTENYGHLVQDLESYGKQNGLFQGQKTVNAITSASDLGGAFLDTLNAMMRETHKPGLTFWQFCPQILNFQKGMGDTMLLPRSPYLSTATDPNDRKLSGKGTFVGIDQGSDNVTTDTISVMIDEWGRGKDSTNKPLAFSEFLATYSMIQLLQLVTTRLVYDYDHWYNLACRNLWNTSAVVYNDGSRVASTNSGITTGDDGTLSREYLINLFAYLLNAQVPVFPDGCYGLWVPALNWPALQNSFEKLFNPATEAQVRELTNFFNPSVIAPGEVNRVSGYQGKLYNFHVFVGNDYASGAAGSPGVTTETIASASRTVRQGFAFGADTIACGVGMPMSIVQDEHRDFGRLNRFTWLAYMGFGRLDVDPSHADGQANEQLRVYAMRNLEVAV